MSYHPSYPPQDPVEAYRAYLSGLQRQNMSARIEQVGLARKTPFSECLDVSTELLTHHICAFTRHKNVQGAAYEQAACGRFVGWTACAPAEQEPTCPACREWLGLDFSIEMIGGGGGGGIDEPENHCLYCGGGCEPTRTYCSSACENAARTE